MGEEVMGAHVERKQYPFHQTIRPKNWPQLSFGTPKPAFWTQFGYRFKTKRFFAVKIVKKRFLGRFFYLENIQYNFWIPGKILIDLLF